MANPQHLDRRTPRVVAHRAATSTWPVDRAWLTLAAARRTGTGRVAAAARAGGAWVARPVTVTRRAHVLVAAVYAFVAVDAGLVAALLAR